MKPKKPAKKAKLVDEWAVVFFSLQPKTSLGPPEYAIFQNKKAAELLAAAWKEFPSRVIKLREVRR